MAVSKKSMISNSSSKKSGKKSSRKASAPAITSAKMATATQLTRPVTLTSPYKAW